MRYCANMRTDGSMRWTIRAPDDVGRTIADLRSARGMTQAQLARQSGIPREYLARLENGATVEMLERALLLLRRLGAEVTVSARAGDRTDTDV